MLYEFLKNNYKEAEPIFFSDIVIKGITKSAVNQQLKKLCNEGKLQKYENGIYYLPKKSRLKTSVGVNAENIHDQLQTADGAIIGSSLKVGGVLTNPISYDLVKKVLDGLK